MKQQLQNRKWKLHDPPPQQPQTKKEMRADGLEAGRSDDVPNGPPPPAKLAAYFSKHRGGQSATSQNPWCVKKPGGTYQHIDHPGCFACGDPNHFVSGCPMQSAHSAPSCVFCGRCGTQFLQMLWAPILNAGAMLNCLMAVAENGNKQKTVCHLFSHHICRQPGNKLKAVTPMHCWNVWCRSRHCQA